MGPDHLIVTPALAYARSEALEDGYSTLELGTARETRVYRRRLSAEEVNAGRNVTATHRFYLPAADEGRVDHLAVLEVAGVRYDVAGPPDVKRRPDGSVTHLEVDAAEVV